MRAVVVAGVAGAALMSACGSDDHPRPALHRPAAAVWCPSKIFRPKPKKLTDARHGAWDARAIIGLDFDDAIRLAHRHDCVLREVGGRDADPREALTLDLRTDRIDVDVTDGVVVGFDRQYGPIG